MRNKAIKVSFVITCLFLFAGFLSSCKKQKVYSFAATSPGTSYYEAGELITDLINKNGEFKFNMLSGKELGSFVNCQKLYNNEVDFAIAQNDTRVLSFVDKKGSIVDSRIRTVMPIYPEILYIVCADTVKATTIQELVTGKRIGVGPKNSGTHRFFQAYLNHCGIDSNSYTFVHTPWAEDVVSDKIDVSVNVGGYNASAVVEMLNTRKCKIFSLGDYKLFGKGSPVEGFCMNYAKARPFIIPMQTYSYGPREPVLTLAVDAVLLCRSDIPASDVSRIVETIFKNKKLLADKNPLLSAINENFDQNSLNFPLHDGTIMYLDRNMPSFFERYADVLGIALTVMLALSGGLATFLQRRKMKKKNRIDIFYRKALDVDSGLQLNDTPEKLTEALLKLKGIKEEAFQLLIEERLIANESFHIFLDLVDNLLLKIENRLK